VPPDPKSAGWRVLGAGDCLDRWDDTEQPPEELRNIVRDWLMTRVEDPHQGVSRMPGFPGWWFGKVAGSDQGWAAVYCTYLIDEETRTVEIRGINTLNRPV
jgi:hypothetical protein